MIVNKGTYASNTGAKRKLQTLVLPMGLSMTGKLRHIELQNFTTF